MRKPCDLTNLIISIRSFKCRKPLLLQTPGRGGSMQEYSDFLEFLQFQEKQILSQGKGNPFPLSVRMGVFKAPSEERY